MKKYIPTYILCMFFSLAMSAQNVNIPDAKFKSLLLAKSSINTDGNDEISVEEAQSFDGIIDVKYEEIFDLTGIEAFTSITKLYCGFNNLTSLDVTQNTELLELSFFYNDIGTIDLSNNVLLTGINCIEANLSSLDLSENVNLIEFYGEGNALSSLDLSNNTALTILDCGMNQLTALDLSRNLKLIEVDCDDNLITEIDISNNTELTKFNCFRNQLTSLNVLSNTKLMHLSCSDNQIIDLDVSFNTELNRLACYDNQLQSLDVSQNVALEVLFCDNNRIPTLDLSKNNQLTFLSTFLNELISLNLQNGNNTILTELYATANPNLLCIQVDDVAWSTENWTYIDEASSFDVNCPLITNNKDIDTYSFQIFPNPVIDIILIEADLNFDGFIIYNLAGQKVLEEKSTNSYLDVQKLDPGCYILQLEYRNTMKSIKFVKH